MNHYFFRSRTVVALGLALSTVTVALRSMEAEDAPSSSKEKTYSPSAGSLLIDAAKAGNRSIVLTALQSQADPNTSESTYGWTALHYAASAGNIEMMKALIDAGANINAQNKEGHTPLYKAVWNSRIAAVQELISSKANVNLPCNVGNTPLHSAVIAANVDIIIMLIIAGADIEARTNHAAIIIEAAGPSTEDEIKSLWTPLHYAAARGNSYEVIQALLKNGSDSKSTDCFNRTSLNIAVQRLYAINTRLDMSRPSNKKLQHNLEQIIQVLEGKQPLSENRSEPITATAPSPQLPQPQISVSQRGNVLARFFGWNTK